MDAGSGRTTTASFSGSNGFLCDREISGYPPLSVSRMTAGALTRTLTITVTYISLSFLRQLHRQLVQSFKVVTRICNLPRFETQPPDHLKDGIKIYTFFTGWISVVESEGEEEEDEDEEEGDEEDQRLVYTCPSFHRSPKITVPTMMFRISKINRNSLCMT
jgi:hypothetical protein